MQDKPWMALAGSLKHLHEENLEIERIVAEEFEQIEPDSESPIFMGDSNCEDDARNPG